VDLSGVCRTRVRRPRSLKPAVRLVLLLAIFVVVGAAPVSAARPNGWFQTPSGNIGCQYGVQPAGAESVVSCGVLSGLVPPEPRPARGCGVVSYWGNIVALSTTGTVSTDPCRGDCGPLCELPHSPVLQYGQSWSGGGLRCSSAVTGLTCRNKSRHGFFLSRQSWRTF
jgi:hypothetical protein